MIAIDQFDNATPFFEAQHTAEILGDQAALVRQDGFGVRSYLAFTLTA